LDKFSAKNAELETNVGRNNVRRKHSVTKPHVRTVTSKASQIQYRTEGESTPSSFKLSSDTARNHCRHNLSHQQLQKLKSENYVDVGSVSSSVTKPTVIDNKSLKTIKGFENEGKEGEEVFQNIRKGNKSVGDAAASDDNTLSNLNVEDFSTRLSPLISRTDSPPPPLYQTLFGTSMSNSSHPRFSVNSSPTNPLLTDFEYYVGKSSSAKLTSASNSCKERAMVNWDQVNQSNEKESYSKTKANFDDKVKASQHSNNILHLHRLFTINCGC
jgi:hypothetical protein